MYEIICEINKLIIDNKLFFSHEYKNRKDRVTLKQGDDIVKEYNRYKDFWNDIDNWPGAYKGFHELYEKFTFLLGFFEGKTNLFCHGGNPASFWIFDLLQVSLCLPLGTNANQNLSCDNVFLFTEKGYTDVVFLLSTQYNEGSSGSFTIDKKVDYSFFYSRDSYQANSNLCCLRGDYPAWDENAFKLFCEFGEFLLEKNFSLLAEDKNSNYYTTFFNQQYNGQKPTFIKSFEDFSKEMHEIGKQMANAFLNDNDETNHCINYQGRNYLYGKYLKWSNDKKTLEDMTMFSLYSLAFNFSTTLQHNKTIDVNDEFFNKFLKYSSEWCSIFSNDEDKEKSNVISYLMIVDSCALMGYKNQHGLIFIRNNFYFIGLVSALYYYQKQLFNKKNSRFDELVHRDQYSQTNDSILFISDVYEYFKTIKKSIG